jgi:hypothetical protein
MKRGRNMDENQNVMPETLSKRVDIKAVTIDAFSYFMQEALPSAKGLDINPSVIIFTNFGTIQGKVVRLQKDENFLKENGDNYTLNLNAVMKQVIKLRNRNLQEVEALHGAENISLVNNSSLIIIEDAIFKPYANQDMVLNISYMTLFADQVVGMSAGDAP